MEALAVTAALALALAAALAFPGWRLKRVLARPLAPAFIAILERNLAPYSRMPQPLRAQLHKLVLQFLHQKKFVGCAGLEVSDEMRVTIAGQACLLLLNRPSRVYPALHAVLLYPSAFLVPRKQVDEAGVVTETRQDLLGESWGDGRVVLAWDHVRRGTQDWNDGQNVVLHEFAHQLDSESGSTNGAPYLGSRSSYRQWAHVLARDFDQLRLDAMGERQGVLDHYGANSPAEFFAVATETFFEKPWQMAEGHAALFAEFLKYYRVDPREWQEAPGPPGFAQGFAPEPEPGPRSGLGPAPEPGRSYGQWQ